MAEHHSEFTQLHADVEETRRASVISEKILEKPALPAVTTTNSVEQSDFNEKADIETPVGGQPTVYERLNLRHVGESLPASVFLVAVIELCERFTYYGCQGIFQNYVQNPPDGSLGPGGLGMGHEGATGLTTFYSFWCYVTPLLGGLIADQYLGKYKTIIVFASIYFVGLLILVLTSIPVSLHNGAGLGGYITSILLTGLGTGGIKANVAPLIAEQYTRRHMEVAVTPKGERVVIDPYVTIQRIYMIFYWTINIGALSLLATPYMERDVGFYSAFTLCTCMFAVGITVLVLGRKTYVDRPPQGSVVTDAFKAVGLMIRYRSMDAPKQSFLRERGSNKTVTWDDSFIDEVKRALTACKVFTLYPIYWVVYGQFSNNFVTQALQMRGHGIPNDLMQNFDPISIIVFVPILDRLVYPMLRKRRIAFKPISRIVTGFTVAALAMMYAAIIQHVIYSRGPCYGHPLCDASIVDGTAQGNNIHIAVQTPAYMFIGISEIFASATGYEYAYTKAPPRMKSFVQSLFLLTNALGSAIGEAFVPAAFDPAIMWLYVGLCIGTFCVAILIWVLFHHLNDKEEEMNYIEDDVLPIDAKRRESHITA
ncbi:POT family proton-dependent oligopeptide transporter [Capronia coronata CBS 617.96]|uniref:POT family proton-dependent oligopeptide transporter n=1 Tax=Capronia coronata CBS 617.96 TaxID=1182541 RepID=W9XT32_9EURO|nr:POT family proton-dependent oligopeptide transporter [Capronia coronata CBS 617.96]EXJ80161.1 POT family proton-dependent oligopeptide transporter [Capronia coronata CBS 617.96]